MKKLSPSFNNLALALPSAGATLYASEMNGRIESSAKESYVFKTYLKADSIKVESKDGIVALLGNVNEESHKTLAQRLCLVYPALCVLITVWSLRATTS